MNRRLVGIAVGTAVLMAGALVMRSEVTPRPRSALGPDGERIAAHHDAAVEPPARSQERPERPGRLRTDARRGGALVSWPPAPFGFEVRWGQAGGRTTSTRFVSTPGTTLAGLSPGRYHVEVRSVDETGQRSEPTGTDVEVGDDEPQWARGLGFAQDFTRDVSLPADRWRTFDAGTDCLRRDGEGGPLLVSGGCIGALRPVSPLTLSEPDGDGVRGRLVVVADSPSQPFSVRDRPPREEGIDYTNQLVVLVGAPMFFPSGALMLRIGASGAYLDPSADFTGPNRQRDTDEVKLDAPPGGPGVLHRWELVFTTDEVRVLLDGNRVGGVRYRPTWRQGEVNLAPIIPPSNDGSPASDAVRVAFLGLTGPAPDGRPVDARELGPQVRNPAKEQRFDVPAVQTAAAATIGGLVVADGSTLDLPNQLPPAPEVVAELDGRRIPLVVRRSDDDSASYWFDAEVDAAQVRRGGALVLRSLRGDFSAFNLLLEVKHRAGTGVATPTVTTATPARPRLPRGELVVRSGENRLFTDDTVRGPEVQVELRLAPQQAPELAGWVALRAELDGRRILDHPTSTDGPAFTADYRFTIHTRDLAPGLLTLIVTLVPDRPGIDATTARFVLRIER